MTRARPHACVGGTQSEAPSWWAVDGRGIPLTRVCARCEKEKIGRYRPEILSHYNESDVDERIDGD